MKQAGCISRILVIVLLTPLHSLKSTAAVPNAATAAAQHTTLTIADADRRKAAACARTVLEAERTVLAAATRDLRTYVVCPGVLYGEIFCFVLL